MKAVRTMFCDIKRLEHLFVPAKDPLKRPQVSHIDCTLGFFWGGVGGGEWRKINYVTVSIVKQEAHL